MVNRTSVRKATASPSRYGPGSLSTSAVFLCRRLLCYNEHSVVGVVEGLRRQVVALEIEGSIPSAHPSSLIHPEPSIPVPCG